MRLHMPGLRVWHAGDEDSQVWPVDWSVNGIVQLLGEGSACSVLYCGIQLACIMARRARVVHAVEKMMHAACMHYDRRRA